MILLPWLSRSSSWVPSVLAVVVWFWMMMVVVVGGRKLDATAPDTAVIEPSVFPTPDN